MATNKRKTDPRKPSVEKKRRPGPRAADAEKKRKTSPRSTVVERRPRGSKRLVRQVAASWHRLLELEAVWILLLLGVGTWLLAPTGFFGAHLGIQKTVGTIAHRDYTATRDLLIADEETTQAKREKARTDVRPVWDFDSSIASERDARFARLFQEGRRLLEEQEAEGADPGDLELQRLERLLETSELTLSSEAVAVLTQREFSPELEERLRGILAQVFRQGVVSSKPLLLENRLGGITLRDLQTGQERAQFDLFSYLGYPDDVSDFLEGQIWAGKGYTRNERNVLRQLLLDNIPPNLQPNRSETLARREAAVEEISTVYTQIREGEVIVRKGDKIDATTARILSEMTGERRLSARALPLLGNLLLLSGAILLLWLAFKKDSFAGATPPRSAFGAVLLVLLVSLLAAKFCFWVAGALSEAQQATPFDSERSYLYAVPFGSLALVTFLLYGRATAMLLSVVFSLFVGRMAGGDSLWAVIYCLAGSLAAIYCLDQFKSRVAVTRAGLVIGLVNMVTCLMLSTFRAEESLGAAQIGFDLVCAFAGGLLVSAAASFAVPILESLLSVTTDIKLLELADTNLPLLRRLAFEAPGTFQHSLMVANLAKAGCEAIGANPVLAYTGALYHDIGKIFRPEYFIENQRPGRNRHDKLSPSMSALIVINHVKEGVQLAKENRLPEPILDAIRQHHGTRLLTFFYNKAQESKESDGKVAEDKYRYPGPKPQNKVMGVLMLADAVEAASRTLVEPTPAKIRSLLRTIVDDCLNDGQLDNTDLTLGHLNRVTEAFTRILTTIYHKRVDYPGFDFNDSQKEVRWRVVDGAKA